MQCKTFLGLVLTLALTACGGGAGSELVNLSSLPSASGLIATNDSSTGLSFAAVAGVPPIVDDLTVEHFYGNLVNTINTAGSATCVQRDHLFGQTSGQASGDTACWMSQGVANAVSNLTQNGNSLCYMKNMPSSPSGVTITPPLADPSTIFNQTSADRLVKVEVTDPGEEGSMNVFIKVYGSSNQDVGETKYKVDLWFCQGDSATGKESFLIDKEALTFTATGLNSHGEEGKGTFELNSSIVIASNGNVSFDLTKDRSAVVQWIHGESFGFKSSIAISGDNIVVAKEKGSGSWGANANYTRAEIAGSGISSLRFLQGATRGFFEPNCEGCSDHSFSGATEWQNTVYNNPGTSEFLDDIPSDYQTEEFYSAAASVDESPLASLSCSAEATYTITMNFEDEGLMKAVAPCENERFIWTDKCNSSEVLAARNLAFACSP